MWKKESCSVMSGSLRPHRLCSPWNSLGQNTGVGSLSLFQGIFPTQGSNPGLPHYGQSLYQLSHKGSPRILEWVAYPFSTGSSQTRNQTGVSCITCGLFWSTLVLAFLYPHSLPWWSYFTILNIIYVLMIPKIYMPRSLSYSLPQIQWPLQHLH